MACGIDRTVRRVAEAVKSKVVDVLCGEVFGPISSDPLHDLLKKAGFSCKTFQTLPSRDFCYPEWVTDGNSEYHRFVVGAAHGRISDPEASAALEDLNAHLKGAKAIFYTAKLNVMEVVGLAAPRMRLGEQASKNTFYSMYHPGLFIVRDANNCIRGHVLKIDPAQDMCWFSLSDEETQSIIAALAKTA